MTLCTNCPFALVDCHRETDDVLACDKYEDYLRKRRAACRRDRDQAMRDLGLVKVRGAVSGKTYWE